MITKEKLNNIYEAVVLEKELTTKELLGYGFTAYELTVLVKEKFLSRVKRGIYELEDLGSLFVYGDALIAEYRLEAAKTCYKKYLAKNPESIKAYYKLLYIAFRTDNFDEILKYYETVINDKNLSDADQHLLLYLMNFNYKLPLNLSYNAKYLTTEDILGEGKNSREQNEFRINIFRKKFGLAINIINNKSEDLTFADYVIKNLLLKAKETHYDFYQKLSKYIRERKFSQLIELINNWSINHKLSKKEVYVLKIAKDCNDLLNGKNIIPARVNQINNAFDAIDYKNYYYALKLWEDGQNTKLGNDNDYTFDSVHLMLENITELISQSQKLKRREEKADTLVSLTFDDLKASVKTTILSDFIGALKENDLECAKIYLGKILSNAKKNSYYNTILNLVNICQFENDLNYNKVVVALTYIINDDLEFEVAAYLNDFYLAIKEKDLIKADLYLQLLKTGMANSNIINQELIDNLSVIMNEMTIINAPSNEDLVVFDNNLLLEKRIYLNNLAISIVNEKKSIEVLIHTLKLKEEDASLLYLLCAKEYYKNNNIMTANYYIRKALEYSNNITTIMYAEEILSEYINNDNELKLILTQY